MITIMIIIIIIIMIIIIHRALQIFSEQQRGINF